MRSTLTCCARAWRSEKHLDGATIDEIKRPALLITNALNWEVSHPPRKDRDAQLIAKVLETVRAGGNVLMPIDTAGRVLELMLMLDQQWGAMQLGQYKLVLLHHMAHNVCVSRMLVFARVRASR